MFNISSYLDKFRKMEPSGCSEKSAAKRAIFGNIGVSVEKESMNVRSGILYLTVSPGIKNEVYMNKTKILKEIQDILGESKIKDIR